MSTILMQPSNGQSTLCSQISQWRIHRSSLSKAQVISDFTWISLLWPQSYSWMSFLVIYSPYFSANIFQDHTPPENSRNAFSSFSCSFTFYPKCSQRLIVAVISLLNDGYDNIGTFQNMSWADLVNNNLVGSGNVSKAAICGFDGSIWGKSDNFKASASISTVPFQLSFLSISWWEIHFFPGPKHS